MFCLRTIVILLAVACFVLADVAEESHETLPIEPPTGEDKSDLKTESSKFLHHYFKKHAFGYPYYGVSYPYYSYYQPFGYYGPSYGRPYGTGYYGYPGYGYPSNYGGYYGGYGYYGGGYGSGYGYFR